MKEPGKIIAMLIPSFYPNKMGGSEIQALRLSQRLVLLGYEVVVFTLNMDHLQKYANVHGIRVIRVSGKLLNIPRGILFLQTRFPLLQRKVKQEILEKYGRPNGTASFLLARFFYALCLREIRIGNIKPSLVQVNTVEWVSVSGALLAQRLEVPLLIKDSTVNGLGKLKLMPFVARWRQWIIDHSFFVAISGFIKRELLAGGVKSERIFTISNGIELREGSTPRDRIIPNSCLFVGNLYQEPAKGFTFLLEAWCLVINDFSDAILNVVGDGDIESYKNLIRSKGLENNVIFWGKQSDIKQFYLSNEIFVLSSIREGMSNSLIEAMSFGLPCVSTMVSGSTDLIEDRRSGLLVEPKNAYALAEAVSFLFKNKVLSKSLGSNALERVRQLCDMGTVSKKYSNVYEKLSQNSNA